MKLHNPLASWAAQRIVKYIDGQWAQSQSVKQDAITQIVEEETHITQFVEALAELEEMATYAARNLNYDWAQKNAVDLQGAIEKARTALKNTP